MARFMAFDYGSKRTGIAVTDPLNIIATGLETIPTGETLTFLKAYLAREQVSRFVVGLPKKMDNTPSDSAKGADQLVRMLEKHFPEIPVRRIDERFTSVMAQQVILQGGVKKQDRRNKELTDTVSAVIILQSYLDNPF